MKKHLITEVHYPLFDDDACQDFPRENSGNSCPFYIPDKRKQTGRICSLEGKFIVEEDSDGSIEQVSPPSWCKLRDGPIDIRQDPKNKRNRHWKHILLRKTKRGAAPKKTQEQIVKEKRDSKVEKWRSDTNIPVMAHDKDGFAAEILERMNQLELESKMKKLIKKEAAERENAELEEYSRTKNYYHD